MLLLGFLFFCFFLFCYTFLKQWENQILFSYHSAVHQLPLCCIITCITLSWSSCHWTPPVTSYKYLIALLILPPSPPSSWELCKYLLLLRIYFSCLEALFPQIMIFSSLCSNYNTVINTSVCVLPYHITCSPDLAMPGKAGRQLMLIFSSSFS